MAVITPTRKRLRKYLEKHNIDPLDERNDLNVVVFRQDAVPMRGNILPTTDRIISRDEADQKYKRIRLKKSSCFWCLTK